MASTPPTAHSESPRTPKSLTLDLSSIPPLSTPAPPSNTLLITNLDSLAIFHPASLATIRQYISGLVPNELHSFSPLKSLRRIVCSFYTIEAAITVRKELDGSTFLGSNSSVSPGAGTPQEQGAPETTARDHEVRARIYFGEPTPVDNSTRYLDKPDAGKLFFISPPPSPPVGWEQITEGAPNKETHASDLQVALEKLGSKIRDGGSFAGAGKEGVSDLEVKVNNATVAKDVDETQEPKSATTTSSTVGGSGTRTRSPTLVIYDPEDHATGQKKGLGLPAVMVEDTTNVEGEDGEGPRLDVDGKKIIAHTSRPPVELMQD